MDFKQYTIALLIVLFCAGSVIVGITGALTSETPVSTSLWNNGNEYQEYQGTPYSTVYYSAPAQGTFVAVPMRSVNSGILRHPQASYQAGAYSVNNVHGGYASQGLTTTAHQVASSYGTSTGGGNGYSVIGGTNYTRGDNVGYSVSAGQRTMASSSIGYVGITTSHGFVGKQGVTSTPILAQATWLDEYTPSPSGRRRIIHADGTADAGDTKEENGQIYVWNEDTESWELLGTTPNIGDKLTTTDGTVYVWNGSMWIPERDIKDPDSPIGDTPWLFFGLLVAGYIGVVTCKKKRKPYTE